MKNFLSIIFFVFYTFSQSLSAQDGDVFNVKKTAVDTSYIIYHTIKKHDTKGKGMMYGYLAVFPDGKAINFVSESYMDKIKLPPYEKLHNAAYLCQCTNDTISFTYPRPNEPNITMLFRGIIKGKRVDGLLQWTNSGTGNLQHEFYNYYRYYGNK